METVEAIGVVVGVLIAVFIGWKAWQKFSDNDSGSGGGGGTGPGGGGTNPNNKPR